MMVRDAFRCMIRDYVPILFETVRWGTQNANNTTADLQAAPAKSQTLQVTALGIMPAETRRMYTCLYNHT